MTKVGAARLALGLALLVGPLAAEPVRIEGVAPVALRAGPGPEYPATGELYPGERAERGACDEVGRWCVVSTDRTWGWIDTGGVVATARRAVPPGLARRGEVPPGLARRLDMPMPDRWPPPARGLAPPPEVAVSPLAPQVPRSGPLPPEIVAAVPPAEAIVPGARPPLLLSTTVPVHNVTDGDVNLRAGPGLDAAIIGRLAPGEGGRIDVCDAPERWCRIAPEGRPPGWVSVRLVGLRRM